MKRRLKKKGRRGKPLKLMELLTQEIHPSCEQWKDLKETRMFLKCSSVPQGGKLSLPLWGFDISEMHTVLSIEALTNAIDAYWPAS